MLNKNIYIISLGGSLVVPPGGVDWKFLKNFRKFLVREMGKGKKFAVIVGGGAVAREYQRAANKVIKLTDDDRDWLGIHATRMNAHLLKTIFREYAHPRINKNPHTKENLKKHFAHGEGMMVAGGWRPGWSTDYVATILAERLGAKTVINLSNIDYVFDKDPKKYKNVKKIENISWKNFRKIVGNRWDPGLNAPFDPVASKNAERLGLRVIIMNGRNLKSLKNYFAGKKFKGTVVG